MLNGSRREGVTLIDDGMWPQRSDDPEWLALLAKAGVLDNDAAKAQLGVDVEAELAGPRVRLAEVVARRHR